MSILSSGDTTRPKEREKLGAELALDMVADKWFVKIVHQLRDGALRYCEIKKCIPDVSHRMLTHTLRNMERDGLLSRTVFPVVPPHTKYALTDGIK